MSGKSYTSTYCGEPQPATDFLQQGTYYWLNLSAPCAMTTQCSQAASTSGVTTTSSEYDYQLFRYALDHNLAFLEDYSDYSTPLVVYYPVLIADTASNTPLPDGISFTWSGNTSYGCTCSGPCQSGRLISSDFANRNFTWCLVTEPGCGPGDVTDPVAGPVQYDVCGYTLNTSAMSAVSGDFMKCSPTNLGQCDNPGTAIEGTMVPKPWRFPCTDSKGATAPDPYWHDCFYDDNLLFSLVKNGTLACNYTCSFWDAVQQGGFTASVGNAPPTPAPPAPSYLSYSTLSSAGSATVSDVVVLYGYSTPSSRVLTSLSPLEQQFLKDNLVKSCSAKSAQYTVANTNISLTGFAQFGQNSLFSSAGVSVSLSIVTPHVIAAGEVASCLQQLSTDTAGTFSDWSYNLPYLSAVSFPTSPVLQDNAGGCMAFPERAPSPPPAPSYQITASSDLGVASDSGNVKSTSETSVSGGGPPAPIQTTPRVVAQRAITRSAPAASNLPSSPAPPPPPPFSPPPDTYRDGGVVFS